MINNISIKETIESINHDIFNQTIGKINYELLKIGCNNGLNGACFDTEENNNNLSKKDIFNIWCKGIKDKDMVRIPEDFLNNPIEISFNLSSMICRGDLF